MSLLREIGEQPAVLRSLVERRDDFAQLGDWLRTVAPQHVVLAARGTSAHVGYYLHYLASTHHRLHVSFASPSLYTQYRRPPRLDGALVIGISQSGQSPDVIAVLDEARRQGRPTLAVVNETQSPLAESADRVLDIAAGPELEVAATKTYSAQLMCMAMLSAELGEDQQRRDELAWIPDAFSEALELEADVVSAAERFAPMERCVVVGRGYDYATTHEWSLKLKELTYVVAERYSAADFRHGPIAMVASGFPVLAIAARGAVSADLVELLTRLRDELEAETLVVSNDPQVLAQAGTAFQLPAALPEWLSPLVSIAPCQLFAYHLARAKGIDPEAPRGLAKVTRTL